MDAEQRQAGGVPAHDKIWLGVFLSLTLIVGCLWLFELLEPHRVAAPAGPWLKYQQRGLTDEQVFGIRRDAN